MASLLRFLNVFMYLGLIFTTLVATQTIQSTVGHISLGIASYLILIFVQAFTMFYFIGVSRMLTNIHTALHSQTHLKDLFEGDIPNDITPYINKTNQLYYEAKLRKRQVIPWALLMIILGMIGFFLGAAHDTGHVQKTVHSGVIYGFLIAATIGVVREWINIGKTNRLLRKIKNLFQIPDGSM